MTDAAGIALDADLQLLFFLHLFTRYYVISVKNGYVQGEYSYRNIAYVLARE
jgi:hypothetical protein